MKINSLKILYIQSIGNVFANYKYLVKKMIRRKMMNTFKRQYDSFFQKTELKKKMYPSSKYFNAKF